MIGYILKKIFGTKNERELKKLQAPLLRMNELEANIKKLSDDELRAKTLKFKEEVANGRAIDDILPEAFAIAREGSVRALSMRPFDVQLIGGMVLHHGKIAEMKTGEGKTLVATLPVYLNALSGKGVHVITVNDYLARRDAEWMGAIYKFLGLTVGTIVHGLNDEERRAAYNCDVTYGTNNEFGFDYLRDNMKFRASDYVQRDFNFAIVDEVDSILIDEARTPLIISGPAEESTDKYYKLDQLVPMLKKDRDYTLDEKSRTVTLTEEGIVNVERLLNVANIYDPVHMETVHHINQALKAHTLFRRDVDYVVKDGEVLIVDEFTGRLMPGRRYSDGLHQALEAKEKVKIERENQTLATITFQNYFRMYKKLAGMTGTAETEAAEFAKIYKLEVMVIPPNKQMIRIDKPDVIYKTEMEKYNAVTMEIEELNKIGRPVLVGTVSIEKSEHLSLLLKRRGIKHTVLNAKHHEKEAEIIAQAGQPYSVTISTNMAGRGTDIVLGNGIAELGGLHVIGTERHEARRIDNQLRGRSGRQGDKGSSRFYLSLEDDLMRIFGSERIAAIMDTLGIEENVPIEHKFISRAIENAQKRVEGHNFDIRKQLLKYDDVMNHQRRVVYGKRREVLLGEKIKENTLEWISEMAEDIVDAYLDEKVHHEEWNILAFNDAIFKQFSLRMNLNHESVVNMGREGVKDSLIKGAIEFYEKKEQEISEPLLRQIERHITLVTIDSLWKDHLLLMDHMREGIGLRGYAQKDPLLEYQKEGFEAFSDMFYMIKENTVERLFRVQVDKERDKDKFEPPKKREQELQYGRSMEVTKKPVIRNKEKVGRNDPCPCGSGKKYKKCCGK